MVPVIAGPTHPYIGASPGCWRRYGELLAREYGDLGFPPWHRLSVDAYAAQHPGVESRRSIQSVAVHLIALSLVLERSLNPAHVTHCLAKAVKRADDFHWLDPPSFAGSPTILDVPLSAAAPEIEIAVTSWAQGVWAAWRAHHDTIRTWAASLD